MAAHGEQAWRYSQFFHHYRQWRGRQQRSMRQVHRAWCALQAKNRLI